jgi:Na+/melibiose symporter-like transporter
VTDLKQDQSPETFLTMRIVFAGGTILFAAVAAWLIAGYRVTEEDVAASRRAVQRASGHPPEAAPTS